MVMMMVMVVASCSRAPVSVHQCSLYSQQPMRCVLLVLGGTLDRFDLEKQQFHAIHLNVSIQQTRKLRQRKVKPCATTVYS